MGAQTTEEEEEVISPGPLWLGQLAPSILIMVIEMQMLPAQRPSCKAGTRAPGSPGAADQSQEGLRDLP
jgi:hypothetical protein